MMNLNEFEKLELLDEQRHSVLLVSTVSNPKGNEETRRQFANQPRCYGCGEPVISADLVPSRLAACCQTTVKKRNSETSKAPRPEAVTEKPMFVLDSTAYLLIVFSIPAPRSR